MQNIGQVYRTKIRQLTDGLNDPAIRLKAIETIQSLIDHIKDDVIDKLCGIQPCGRWRSGTWIGRTRRGLKDGVTVADIGLFLRSQNATCIH